MTKKSHLKFLKADFMTCLVYQRLNFSTSILAASLTSLSSSLFYFLMLRVVLLRIGVLYWSRGSQVIPSGEGSSCVTWFGVGGAGFLWGIGLCGRVMMSCISFRAAGWYGNARGWRTSFVVHSENRGGLFQLNFAPMIWEVSDSLIAFILVMTTWFDISFRSNVW